MELENNIFTEASLSDSVIYQSFNKNNEMTRIILTAIKESIILDKSYIEEQLLQMERTRISPFGNDVVQAFLDQEIILLYNKGIKKIPKLLPYFVMKQGSKKIAFIFVNNYGALSKSETDSSKKYLNISMKDLYVLLEGAYIGLSYANKPTQITKDLGLMGLSLTIYTQLWLRILNKNYAVSIDPEIYANTIFAISRFFLERVWMTTGSHDIVFNYAVKNVKTIAGLMNQTDILMVDDNYSKESIVTIEDLIKFIKQLSPRFKDLSFRYFFECYVMMYKDPAVFGLESLPYFLFVVQATLLGSFIVSTPIISDILKNIKGMNNFYPELVRSVS